MEEDPGTVTAVIEDYLEMQPPSDVKGKPPHYNEEFLRKSIARHFTKAHIEENGMTVDQLEDYFKKLLIQHTAKAHKDPVLLAETFNCTERLIKNILQLKPKIYTVKREIEELTEKEKSLIIAFHETMLEWGKRLICNENTINEERVLEKALEVKRFYRLALCIPMQKWHTEYQSDLLKAFIQQENMPEGPGKFSLETKDIYLDIKDMLDPSIKVDLNTSLETDCDGWNCPVDCDGKFAESDLRTDKKQSKKADTGEVKDRDEELDETVEVVEIVDDHDNEISALYQDIKDEPPIELNDNDDEEAREPKDDFLNDDSGGDNGDMDSDDELYAPSKITSDYDSDSDDVPLAIIAKSQASKKSNADASKRPSRSTRLRAVKEKQSIDDDPIPHCSGINTKTVVIASNHKSEVNTYAQALEHLAMLREYVILKGYQPPLPLIERLHETFSQY